MNDLPRGMYWAGAGFCLILALFFGWSGYGALSEAENFRTNAEDVEARVLRSREDTFDDGRRRTTTCSVQVIYDRGEDQVHASYHVDRRCTVQTGDTVRIVVLPDEPDTVYQQTDERITSARAGERPRVVYFRGGLSGLAVVAALVLVGLSFRSRS